MNGDKTGINNLDEMAHETVQKEDSAVRTQRTLEQRKMLETIK
jgi:hypothetical protein